jgi:flavin reductase (DIM6/NTAB) family NADH-FMN oxidoreductase RutF
MTPVTPDAFKAAMGSFAAGVTVITVMDASGTPFGLTATAFSSVSKTPPLCLVCVSRDADAYPALIATGRFAVNLLSESQEALSNLFATHGADKFAGVAWTKGPATGMPLLDGAIASVECTVTERMVAGDHDVFVGALAGVKVDSGSPLLYFRGRYGALQGR